MPKSATRDEVSRTGVDATPYRRLLDVMATKIVDQGHHRLMTTNWDYLLQRDLNNWIQANRLAWVALPIARFEVQMSP